jgi:hypothetical protein
MRRMVLRSTPATFWDCACALLMDLANRRLSGDYSHLNLNVISLIFATQKDANNSCMDC